jgi:hypothetical protein
MSHLLLQLEDPIQKCFCSGRATRDIYVDRDDPIHSSNHTITVVIVSTSISTAAHGDDPLWVGHLVRNLTEGGCHLVRGRPSDDHHVGLAWRCPEDNAQPVLIVARH